jgi:8-oxo-dGTP diphosphatase
MDVARGNCLVASVSIISDEKVLIIRENKPTTVEKWNFPSGRIEYGGTLKEQESFFSY